MKSQSMYLKDNNMKFFAEKNSQKYDKKIHSQIKLFKILGPLCLKNLQTPQKNLHATSNFKSLQNTSNYKPKFSLHLNSNKEMKLEEKIEFRENPQNFKNSFVETQESLLELSSFVNENTLETLKHVIDLEEKRQNTRKALLKCRYIKEYSNDYKPKDVTSNKCNFIFIFFIYYRILDFTAPPVNYKDIKTINQKNSNHSTSTKKNNELIDLDRFINEKIMKKIDSKYNHKSFNRYQ